MEQIYSQPTNAELTSILKTSDDDTTQCFGENEWTNWNSAMDADDDDFETLHDHILLFG